jgi:hypothetical protein
MSSAVLWLGEGTPEDDALMEVLGNFLWLLEFFDERHVAIQKVLFDFPDGDQVFSAWSKLAVALKKFRAKWLQVFDLGTFEAGGEFKPSQDMPSALPELREVIECFGCFSQMLVAAVPALKAFETAQGEVFAGRARRNDDFGYGAIVAQAKQSGGTA